MNQSSQTSSPWRCCLDVFRLRCTSLNVPPFQPYLAHISPCCLDSECGIAHYLCLLASLQYFHRMICTGLTMRADRWTSNNPGKKEKSVIIKPPTSHPIGPATGNVAVTQSANLTAPKAPPVHYHKVEYDEHGCKSYASQSELVGHHLSRRRDYGGSTIASCQRDLSKGAAPLASPHTLLLTHV